MKTRLPKIQSIEARWIPPHQHELHVVANGHGFLSRQEAREITGNPRTTGTVLIVDGTEVATLFYSSSQIGAQIPRARLKSQWRCSIQVAHPIPRRLMTPPLAVQLRRQAAACPDDPPRQTPSQDAAPEAQPTSPTPQPETSDEGIAPAQATVPPAPRIHKIRLRRAASAETAAGYELQVEGQGFLADAVVYLDNTALQTVMESQGLLRAGLPPEVSWRNREFWVMVCCNRQQGLRISNRLRIRISSPHPDAGPTSGPLEPLEQSAVNHSADPAS